METDERNHEFEETLRGKRSEDIEGEGEGENTKYAKDCYDAEGIIRTIKHFDGARSHLLPKRRTQIVKDRAIQFREMMSKGPMVKFYKTCDLVRAPYPTKYGFRDASSALISPYMHVLNRLFIIQFEVGNSGHYKTLLVSPSDVEGAAATPYFKRIADQFGRTLPYIRPLIAPVYGTVEYYLEENNIDPKDVDYITYDHLHTQDLRKWLGDGINPGYFPNAKLLVMREEWESTKNLLPIQADWYCPNGIQGVPENRVIILDHDVMVGDSVALIRTPGHTMGNHSIVANTPDGLLVTSETGVSADSYSPYYSKIPGFKKFVEDTGIDVVLNGNTLESSIEQYISMIQEREIAGPCPYHLDFYNVVPSSEMVHFYLFPRISPTFFFGNLEYGKPVVKEMY